MLGGKKKKNIYASKLNGSTTGTRTLRRQLQRLRSGQAHHDTAVGHRLEKYARKGGAAPRQCGGRVKVFLLEETAAPDGGEYL